MTTMNPDRSRGVRVMNLVVADDPEAWSAAGFAVETDESHLSIVRIGDTDVKLVGRQANGPTGVLEWSVAGLGSSGTHLDGLRTTFVKGDPADRLSFVTPDDDEHEPAAASHQNGVTGIDHIVIATPDLERTIEAIEVHNVSCRRIREAGTDAKPMRQAFFKFGPLTIEVVSGAEGSGQPAEEGPSTVWGLALNVRDIDRVLEELGPIGCSEPRSAVQEGRRIATLRTEHFDISVPIALMDDHRVVEPPTPPTATESSPTDV